MKEVDESHCGVKTGAVSGEPIVDRDAYDESQQPKSELESLSPGDVITVAGDEMVVRSVGSRSNYEQKGLYSLMLDPKDNRIMRTLYVDRDPYLLQKTGFWVKSVQPSEVSV